MEDRLTRTVDRLLSRLEDAGREHPDLRCVLSREIPRVSEVWFEHFGEYFGGLQGYLHQDWQSDRESRSLGLFRESAKDNCPVAIRRRTEEERFAKFDEQQAISSRLYLLLNECWQVLAELRVESPDMQWLAKDRDKLIPSPMAWMWCLHEVANRQIAGSTLRAVRYFPKLELRQTVANSTRDPWSGADRLISDLRVAIDDPSEGRYVSILNADPFTASAMLIDLLLAGVPTVDETAYLLLSQLDWREHFTSEKRATAFLDKNENLIRQIRKPKRRLVHAADWLKHWNSVAPSNFDALGDDDEPDEKTAMEYAQRLKEVRRKGLPD